MQRNDFVHEKNNSFSSEIMSSSILNKSFLLKGRSALVY